MTRKTRIVTICFAAAIAATGLNALAGDLNPPPGAVAPTMKTLTEVEPRIAVNAANTPGDADSLFKITQPGSYYLTGNISGLAGKHGIEIAASSVTLDLNGFDLVGVAGSLDGVSTVSNLTNIAVVNGSVRSWGDEGVDLGTFAATNCRVAEVLASGNTGTGIRAGSGSTVTNCSASSNTGDGISTAFCTTVTRCAAYDNTGNGFVVENGSTVSNCSAFGNADSGIGTGSGCTVVDCTARSNALDGIVGLSSGCVIRGNTCSSNGSGGDGAGIHVFGGDNRIEGNNCTSADRGIDVDAAGNIIIKNTCAGNTTNWDIVVGNAVAPIVSATTNAAAILGNTYAGSLGSTDPNANFTY